MTLYNPSPDLADPAEPEPAATSDNPFLRAEVPSIAVVIQRIGDDKRLSASRCAALASALRTMARRFCQLSRQFNRAMTLSRETAQAA